MTLRQAIKHVENGKTVRLDGQTSGVYFASTVQQFWEAVRHFEAAGSKYKMETVE